MKDKVIELKISDYKSSYIIKAKDYEFSLNLSKIRRSFLILLMLAMENNEFDTYRTEMSYFIGEIEEISYFFDKVFNEENKD